MVHSKPQTLQRESVVEPETRLLIIDRVLCQYDIEGVQKTSPTHFSKRKSVERNILGRWKNAEGVAHTLINLYSLNIDNIRYRTTSAQKGQATIGHPFPHQLNISIQMAHHISQTSKCKLYDYISSLSIRTKPEVFRRNHLA